MPSRLRKLPMKNKQKWLAGILLLLCLVFIWGNSLLPAEDSGAMSGRLSQILAAVFGSWAVEAEGVFRKLAHFTEFALLGMLLGWNEKLYRGRRTVLGPFLGLLAAMTDETLQLFSDGRAGMVADVWLDFAGVLGGIGLLSLLPRLKNRKRKTQSK